LPVRKVQPPSPILAMLTRTSSPSAASRGAGWTIRRRGSRRTSAAPRGATAGTDERGIGASSTEFRNKVRRGPAGTFLACEACRRRCAGWGNHRRRAGHRAHERRARPLHDDRRTLSLLRNAYLADSHLDRWTWHRGARHRRFGVFRHRLGPRPRLRRESRPGKRRIAGAHYIAGTAHPDPGWTGKLSYAKQHDQGVVVLAAPASSK